MWVLDKCLVYFSFWIIRSKPASILLTEVNDMPAKAKKITLYLENGTLDGLINIAESDGWDFGGELYSCPRNKLEELLDDESVVNKVGVYLLLSNKQVYIGQSTDLRSRIMQHKLSKDWWERVILLTSKKNELNQSHITYLEAALIQKAIDCGTIDSENKTGGNKHNLDRYETKLLDQFLDEAYFVLELIGVQVFVKGSKKTNTKTVLPPIPDSTQKEIEFRAKSEVGNFLSQHGVKLNKFYSYAKLQEKKKTFWVNPRTELLNEDWMLILNNQLTKTIYVLSIPKNTFVCSLNHTPNSLVIRPDKPQYIDLNIHQTSFVDLRSKLSFKEYITKEIKY